MTHAPAAATGPGAEGAPSFARVVRVATTGSTNADLVAALRRGEEDAWPHLAVLVADHQAAGRGRSGREWSTPPGAALTASVVLRPPVPLERWSWLGLVAGLAVARAIRARTGLPAALKWPNDVVLVGAATRVEPGWGTDRKVAGVLAQVVPLARPVAVVGFGVNVHQGERDLPVPWAASLASVGAGNEARDLRGLLDAVGREFAALDAAFRAGRGDAVAAGIAGDVAGACATLGRDVRVRVPGGRTVAGRAVRLADDGALVLRPPGGGEVVITAGDVDHIRVVTD